MTSPRTLQDCERTIITAAARRVVVSNCHDVVNYLFTPSPPLLVGDNNGCQLAPYNTYYDGLRQDLLATGLAAALRSSLMSGDTPASPSRGGGDGGISPTAAHPALQCASNKWKFPVGELISCYSVTQVCVIHMHSNTSLFGIRTGQTGNPSYAACCQYWLALRCG